MLKRGLSGKNRRQRFGHRHLKRKKLPSQSEEDLDVPQKRNKSQRVGEQGSAKTRLIAYEVGV